MSGLRVLVVEDDPDLLLVMQHELRLAGHTVMVAETIERAVSQAADADLVLLDFHLPDGDGLDVMEQIQRLPEPPSVVMVTGDDLGGLDETVIRAGAVDFIPKRPGYLRALPGIVERAARQHDLARRVADFEGVALGLLATETFEETASEIVHGACRMLRAARAALVPLDDDGAPRLERVIQRGGAGELVEMLSGMPARELPSPGDALAISDDALVVRLPGTTATPWVLLFGGVADADARDERSLAQAYGRVAASALHAIERRQEQLELVQALQTAAAGRLQRDTGAGAAAIDQLQRAEVELEKLLGDGVQDPAVVRSVGRAEGLITAARSAIQDLLGQGEVSAGAGG